MSVFRVKLQNVAQGRLDLDPSTASPVAVANAADPYLGSQMDPSIQRTIFVAGPHRITRALHDGQTFTDCNYWKRFAYPQTTFEQAFIEVVSDDGSVYSDYEVENTYPLVFGGASAYNVFDHDTFVTNYIDILGTYGSYAVFVQITNLGTGGTQDITVQLNGSANAVFTLGYGDTQVFNAADLLVSKLAFDGGSSDTTIQIILSLKSQCNS